MAYPPVPTLLLSDVPEIQSWTGFSNPSVGPIQTAALTQGGRLSADTMNERAGRLDLTGRYGGGVWGVIPGDTGDGLGLTAGAGLTLNIDAGHAMFDGILPIDPSSVSLTDNISRVFIWLSQGGAVVQVNASTTPPGGAHLYLGSCVTDSPAGSISGIDFTGVVYLNGGTAHRFSLDSATPGDAPPANTTFLHHSEGDGTLWLWDGAAYWPISSGSLSGRSRFSYAPSNGTNTLTAGETNNTFIDISIGTVSAAWVLELTVAGIPAIPAGYVWEIDNGSAYGVRIAKAGSGAAYTVLGAGQAGSFIYNGNEVVEIARNGPRAYSKAITGDWTPTAHEVETDYLFVSSVGVNNLNLPGTAGFDGRVVWVHASDAQSALVVQAAGEGNAERISRLLPGEIQPFVLAGSGSRYLGVMKPYTRIVTHEMTSDANYALTAVQALGSIIRITDTVVTLTVGRNIIMPLVADKSWLVYNATGQTLTFIGASGTGLAVVAGKHAMIYTDGTNVDGVQLP